jgi:hypothetical protein
MKRIENKSSQITLHYPGGEPFRINVLDIHSVVALSPFVTDLLLTNGEIETVEGSILEVVSLINNSNHPIFKSMEGLSVNLKKLINLNQYRKMNYGTEDN